MSLGRPELRGSLVVGVIFVSRILDGLTGGNISVAQAYIADVTDEQSRARGLGMIGAAFGLGFILGPAVGGALSAWGYSAPAFAAAGLSTLNLTMVALLLPESLASDQRASLAKSARESPSLNLGALRKALDRPLVGPLLTTRFFFGLGFSTFQTIFPLYSQYHLGLTVQVTGFVLTYVGVLVVLVQALGIGWLTVRYSESSLIFGATVLMAGSLLAWAFVPNLSLLLVVLAPVALAGGTNNTIINGHLSKAVSPEEFGGTLGLSTSLESLTRALAPSIGGALLGQLGTWAPGVFSGLVLAGLVPYVWRRITVPHLGSRIPSRIEERSSDASEVDLA